MSPKLPFFGLICFLVPTLPVQAGSFPLVNYDFEVVGIETGPATLMVFAKGEGNLFITREHSFSGKRAVEIGAVAGDGEFTELQGFFPDPEKGKIFIHFAFMTSTPREPLNIALAGPAHFFLIKDGIGFWLKTKEGDLFQVTAGADQKLFPVQAFTWYEVDIAYDIERGTYDLDIFQPGEKTPIVFLSDQSNAVNIPGSRIHKISFIDDPPGVDRSNVRFFVDDLVISAEERMEPSPFVAPGRRQFFVEDFNGFGKTSQQKLLCPAVLDSSDFGATDPDMEEIFRLKRLLFKMIEDGWEDSGTVWEFFPPYYRRLLIGMDLWRRGCKALKNGRTQAAFENFREAEEQVPQAKLYSMSVVLALAAEERWEEADDRFRSLSWDWQGDPRLTGIQARFRMLQGDLVEAGEVLWMSRRRMPDPADHPLLRRLWRGRVNASLVEELKSHFSQTWKGLVETALTSDLSYHILLLQGKNDEARSFAVRMAAYFRKIGLPDAGWWERKGDAEFFAGKYQKARKSYQKVLKERRESSFLILKLSDVHFQLGNLRRERKYREKIYGTLR